MFNGGEIEYVRYVIYMLYILNIYGYCIYILYIIKILKMEIYFMSYEDFRKGKFICIIFLLVLFWVIG